MTVEHTQPLTLVARSRLACRSAWTAPLTASQDALLISPLEVLFVQLEEVESKRQSHGTVVMQATITTVLSDIVGGHVVVLPGAVYVSCATAIPV